MPLEFTQEDFFVYNSTFTNERFDFFLKFWNLNLFTWIIFPVLRVTS